MERAEQPPERPELDPAADTGKFQAFVGDDDQATPYQGGGNRQVFRIATLLIGLTAFVGIVLLLLR